MMLIVVALSIIKICDAQKTISINLNKPVVEGMINARIDYKNSKIYFFNRNIHNNSRIKEGMYSYDIESGKVETIFLIENVREVSFSPDFQSAIVTVLYKYELFKKTNSPFLNSSIQDYQEVYWYINFSSRKMDWLGESLDGFCWINRQEIFAQYYDVSVEPSQNYLAIYNLETKKLKKICDTDFYDVFLLEAFNDHVYFQDKPTEFPHINKVLDINLSTGKIERFTNQRDIFDGKISYSGEYFLLSSYDERKKVPYTHIFDMKTRKFLNYRSEYNEVSYTWAQDANEFIEIMEINSRFRLNHYNIDNNVIQKYQINVETAASSQLDNFFLISRTIYLSYFNNLFIANLN
ncbi:hypothetical protein COT76_00860 [Candidatus Berkelbacteria bacterium CG10_big_fil_rev_8_21_14_0_10_33_10]|nr:MAG: hypothetical protein COT76_00860 [Candidatus Berkelbacteria bacterium CG10_big_fil_rev_8_21_14_0_10_33_10]